MSGPSFDRSVVDLNPVPIGILKIHLPNTVRSDRNLSQCARKILKCDPTACQLAKGLVEARRRKRKVGGSRPARWNVCCAEDQMDGPSRAEPGALHGSLRHSVGGRDPQEGDDED